MKILKELARHGTIFNEETLNNILKPITSRTNLDDSVLEQQRVFYYTSNSRSIRDYSFHNSEEAAFKIVKFTSTRNFFNHPWAFGFIKQHTPEGIVWRGAYAGIHGELFSKIKKVTRSADKNKMLTSKVNFPRAITRADIFKRFDSEKVTEEIYESLSDKEEWDDLGGMAGLKTYLENLIYVARDKALFQKVKSPEFIIHESSSSRQYLMFNTGLFDKYLNFIMIRVGLAHHSMSMLLEPYFAVISVEVVKNLSEYGLKEPLPVIKMCDKTKLVFPVDQISSLDRQGIDHIFTDRYSRLSEELQNCSLELLYNSLEYSVKLALKMSKVDTQYLVPFLNMKWNKVSYLMPLYVRHIDNENPVCAIVIGEVGDNIWAPVTTLRLETARSNARLLGKLNSSWLVNRKGGLVYENSES